MIKQNFILLVYNRDVTCIIDTGKEPVCTSSPRISRRHDLSQLPSHDPYIPRNDSILFNCSIKCKIVLSNSMIELVAPNVNLKSCYPENADSYNCETLRYHYFKNVDKVLFLSKMMKDKSFYLVDCLIYAGNERVCHKKDDVNSFANLVDTGTMARPKELNVLAQDEFICEESPEKEVRCDLNPFVPFNDGLKLKETMEFGQNVLLKTGAYVVLLNRNCIGFWCGYTGRILTTRRQFGYRPPGGSVYRCYYANRQQICKLWYTKADKEVYNARGWLSNR